MNIPAGVLALIAVVCGSYALDARAQGRPADVSFYGVLAVLCAVAAVCGVFGL